MKRLTAFFYFLTLVMAVACVACEFRLKPSEEGDQVWQMHVQRYDRLESRYLTTGDFAALQQMNTDYSIETRTLLEDMLQLGEVNDPTINARFLYFYQDTLLQMVISDVQAQYADMSDVDHQLQQSFRRLLKMLPEVQVPLVYSQIGALGQSIVVGEGIVGISLDKYLGKDYPLYANFYDEVQRQSMERRYIVPDCLVFYLLSLYPLKNFDSCSQQQRDEHIGRVMWVANKALDTDFYKTDHVRKADRFMKKHPTMSVKRYLLEEPL